MVSVVGIKYGRIDWFEPFCLIFWGPLLHFMVILHKVFFYGYFQTISSLWVISKKSTFISTAFRHYIIVNITLAFQLFTLPSLFIISVYLFKQLLLKSPVSITTKKVTCDNYGTQTRKSNCGWYTKIYSSGKFHCTQCTILSTTFQTYPSFLL